MQVDFGASFGVKQVTRLTKVLDSYNYVAYQNEIDMGKHGNYSDMDIWRSVDGFDYQDVVVRSCNTVSAMRITRRRASC